MSRKVKLPNGKVVYKAKFDWEVHPGEMLEDYLSDEYLSDKGLEKSKILKLLSLEILELEKLLKGEVDMTLDQAHLIADLLNMPTYYWVNSVNDWNSFQAKKRKSLKYRLNSLLSKVLKFFNFIP